MKNQNRFWLPPAELEPSHQFKINHTQPTTEQKQLKISNPLSSQSRDPSTSRIKLKIIIQQQTKM